MVRHKNEAPKEVPGVGALREVHAFTSSHLQLGAPGLEMMRLRQNPAQSLWSGDSQGNVTSLGVTSGNPGTSHPWKVPAPSLAAAVIQLALGHSPLGSPVSWRKNAHPAHGQLWGGPISDDFTHLEAEHLL